MTTRILSLLLTVLLLAACNKEDDSKSTVLNYDGNNNSGPLLDIGDHEAAVRFPASMMADYTGQKLQSIRWYMLNPPAACILKVYDSGSNTQPGALLYQADVSNSIKSQSWHDHDLTRNVEISGADLWISIALSHDINMQSIGCDIGPNQSGGDWLLDADDQLWIPYTIRTPESINWNIRATVGSE